MVIVEKCWAYDDGVLQVQHWGQNGVAVVVGDDNLGAAAAVAIDVGRNAGSGQERAADALDDGAVADRAAAAAVGCAALGRR